MPNNSYLRSRAREQALVRDYKKRGWISARSAGSKSAYDVWALNPATKEIEVTQIKTKKGGRKVKAKVLGKEDGYTFKFIWLSYE